jgi:hypothetical protein
MMNTGFVRRVTLLLVACVFLNGCGGNKRVNKDNFAKIKPNMHLDEVEGILGKGEVEGGTSLPEGSSVAGAAGIGGDLSSISRPASGPKWVKWGDSNKWIRIGFIGDRVQQGMIQQQGL